MATAEHIPGSILTTVVEHEKALMAQLEEARESARAVVDDARSKAQAHIQSEEAKLADEVASMRTDAENSRTAAFDATVRAAEEQLAGVRATADARVSDVAGQVLALFVPEIGGAK